MNKLKTVILIVGMTFIFGGSLLTTAVPNEVFAAAAAPAASGLTIADCSKSFLTFPTWFNGLVKIGTTALGAPECQIKSPDEVGGIGPFIWHIVLNVISIGLQLVAYAAAFMIIYGGFLFLTSDGSEKRIEDARHTILNAVIGLVISIASVAIVNLILGIIG